MNCSICNKRKGKEYEVELNISIFEWTSFDEHADVDVLKEDMTVKTVYICEECEEELKQKDWNLYDLAEEFIRRERNEIN
jgi:D-ribose pyranose/furanose isomerase RbsD